MRYLHHLLAVLVLIPAALSAAPLKFESAATSATLVELFTSEGCSSCPPADRWLSGLVDDPRLWRELVPVAFHVDYWDGIGWPDRFASADYSRRQRHYAASGQVGSVYTPGFVVAGSEWRGWFRGQPLQTAAANAAGVLALSVDGDSVTAEFTPPPGGGGGYVLHVARLGFGLETDVGAGENRGATLRHDFVVLGYRSLPLSRVDAVLRLATTLPDASQQAPREGIAAWISAGNSPVPLQATGGWLPN